MPNDLISIVVPVYKVEKYLNNCIKSILMQTYENLEVILVDDGSPDSCPQICDALAKQDNRIRVIHKKNGGLSDARNAGLEISRGKYITFVDSDDFVSNDMIEILYNMCINLQADFAMCQKADCGEDDTIDSVEYDVSEIKYKTFENAEKMSAYLVTNEVETTAWKKLYRSSLIKQFRFPKGKIHEDAFTTYLIVDKAEKIAVTNKIGYYYRNNPQSIMNSGFSINRLHSIEAKREQLSFIEVKYPTLFKYAAAEVVYACNYCLKEMALRDYYDKSIETDIQTLFREYVRYYISVNNVSFSGKVISVAAFINTRFARMIIRVAMK